MNNTDIRSLYGLKYNPFLPDLLPKALFTIPGTERFALRIQTMAAQPKFAKTNQGLASLGVSLLLAIADSVIFAFSG